MNVLVVFVGMFGAGLAASLTPCSLPLVPGWLGVVVDGAAGSSRATRVACFAAAAVLTFAVLGSAAAAAGAAVVASGLAQRIAGVLLLAGALASVAAAKGRWSRQWRAPVRVPSSPLPRAVALGVGCGAAWTPCVGPLLGAALTAAGTGGSVWRGAALLAAFGSGSVAPLLALSALPSNRVPTSWRRAGRAARRVTPIVLAVLGLLLLSGRYDDVVQRLPIAT